MKKKLFTIPMIVIISAIALFFIMLLIIGEVNHYNRLLFLLRHSIYFILITLVTVTLLYVFYNLIIQKYLDKGYKIIYLKIFTLMFFAATLIITSTLRINYINTYETPIVTYFVLYDDYNNRIYESNFRRIESEIMVLEKSEQTLRLEVTEKSDGVRRHYDNGSFLYNIDRFYESRSLIDIQYNEHFQITDYEIQQEYIVRSNDQGDVSTFQWSRLFRMENIYSYNDFTSTRKTAAMTSDVTFDDYYDFSESELNESVISVAYDGGFTYILNINDIYTIPLTLSWHPDTADKFINHTYSIGNTPIIDDFAYVKFDTKSRDKNIVTTVNSPMNELGEYVRYTLRRDLYIKDQIADPYYDTEKTFIYQENVNDYYLFGSIYSNNEIEEYVILEETEYGFKTTFFRYLDKDATDNEIRWLKEHTQASSGGWPYFDYHEILIDFSSNHYHIIFEENPIYNLIN